MVNDLNECVLEKALALFTNLVGLHIVGCPKVDHVATLQLTSHVPLLESLSLTTSVSYQTRILSNYLKLWNNAFLSFRKTLGRWSFHLHRFAIWEIWQSMPDIVLHRHLLLPFLPLFSPISNFHHLHWHHLLSNFQSEKLSLERLSSHSYLKIMAIVFKN